MTDNWKICDLQTNKFLSDVFDTITEAHKRIATIQESIPSADLIPVMIMVPDKRFSIYTRVLPILGDPGDWRFVIDADTIAESIDRITYWMDQEEETLPYGYKIAFTGHPDMVVMEMQTGKFYPHLKEDEG